MPVVGDEVLHRPLYRGEIVWNKTRKRDAAGKTAAAAARKRSGSTSIVRTSGSCPTTSGTPRTRTRRHSHAPRPHGRAPRRASARHRVALPALRVRPVRAVRRRALRPEPRPGARGRITFYGCLAHHKRGATICNNALVMPIDRVHDAVLARLVRRLLHPAIVTAILDGVFEACSPRRSRRTSTRLTKGLHTLDLKIAGLTAAIEDGAASRRRREVQHGSGTRALLAEIGAAEAIGQLTVDRKTIEWKVSRSSPAGGRDWRNGGAACTGSARRATPLRARRSGSIDSKIDGTGALITNLIGDSTFCGVPNGTRADVWTTSNCVPNGTRSDAWGSDQDRIGRPSARTSGVTAGL